jgi:hypothetical protein
MRKKWPCYWRNGLKSDTENVLKSRSLPKSNAVPWQAADFLAWEWVKFRHETMEQSKRRIRKSLREAFLAAPGRYKMHHIGEVFTPHS